MSCFYFHFYLADKETIYRESDFIVACTVLNDETRGKTLLINSICFKMFLVQTKGIHSSPSSLVGILCHRKPRNRKMLCMGRCGCGMFGLTLGTKFLIVCDK